MTPLYGLVVCGGKSTRMGSDKSLLNYHGKPQRYHVYELLQPLCERVFISCNSIQAPDIPAEYPVLVDEPEYAGIGPMAALLTAFRHYPEAAFLAIGCDYPFIGTEHLQQLSKVTLHTIYAAAHYNNSTNLYEPLIAGYQSSVLSLLNNSFNQSNFSLQSVLRTVNADTIILENPIIIKSIDTADEYKNALMQLYNTKNDNAN